LILEGEGDAERVFQVFSTKDSQLERFYEREAFYFIKIENYGRR
jgi:hypothetical protein